MLHESVAQFAQLSAFPSEGVNLLSPMAFPAELFGGPRDEVTAALAAGRPALITDCSGDGVVVVSARHATAEMLHFVIRHSSGLVHAVLRSRHLDRLRVPDQPVYASEHSGIGFTVAVDAAAKITTGISAADRAETLRVLANAASVPDDLIRPGHVLPIRCDDHDLAEPTMWDLALHLVETADPDSLAAAGARLVADTGESLRGAALRTFAAEHNLPLLETC